MNLNLELKYLYTKSNRCKKILLPIQLYTKAYFLYTKIKYLAKN